VAAKMFSENVQHKI